MLLGIPDVMLGALPPQQSVQKARAAAAKAREIDPMVPEGNTECQKAVDDANRVQLAASSLAHAYAVGGNRAEAQKLLAEMQERAKTEYVSSYLIAEIYVALGEKEPGFKLLETAYADR